MKRRSIYIYNLVILLTVSFFNCGSKTDSGIVERELEEVLSWGGVDVVDEGMIGGVNDFIVTSLGEVAAIDFRYNQIKFFSRDGKFIRKFGSQGQGPEELSRPIKISEAGGELIIFDTENNRFQHLTLKGDFIKAAKLEKYLGYNAFCTDSDMNKYVSSEGFRSEKLIRKLDKLGNEIDAFGELEGHSFEMYSFGEMHEAARKGEVPTSEKNTVLLTITSENQLFAFHTAIPAIRSFNLDGSLDFEKTVADPIFDSLMENYIARNDSLPPSRFFGLTFWQDIEPDDNGGVYVLLNDRSRMTVYHYDSTGELIEKLYGPEDRILDFAIFNNELYAYGFDSLKFYVLKLE